MLKTMDLQLGKEAIGVGALLVPVYAVVRKGVVDFTWKNESTRDYVAVFLSGAVFHILAEASGLNEWYLTNSHANSNWLRNNVAARPRCGDGRLCSLAVWASSN